MQRVTWRTNHDEVIAVTNAYTTLATGLYHRDLASGQWVESLERIDPNPGGAAATNGPHRVIFASDMATGATDLEMPDGQRMITRVIGLSLADATNNVWLAVLKDSCPGQIVGSNQVVYADAFTGVSADVRYTYTRAGLEQDILLRAQLPRPESYGLSRIRSCRCGQSF